MTGPARILLVDDDALFRESLALNLADAGFAVAEADSGPAALAVLTGGGPAADIDLALLDWKMPGMNGIELLRRMRDGGIDLPVIFLTTLSNQIYEEAALQGGAVDFVEKTRSFSILLKRIHLIIGGRKTAAASSAPAPVSSRAGEGVLVLGPLELRRDSHRAFWRGREVPLSVTEFRMVEMLAAAAGQDIPYRDLYDLVHGGGFVAGYGEEGYRGNVRAFMKRIRRKFREIDGDFDEIESYSGFGYRWLRPGDPRGGGGGGGGGDA